MAQASKVSSVAAIIYFLTFCATRTAGQCSDAPEVMQCNVPYWCKLRVGGFPVVDARVPDCKCWQLCNDALEQGEGSTCNFQDDPSGGRWFSIIFDREDGDDNYRGTVFCDPRGGHGRKLLVIPNKV